MFIFRPTLVIAAIGVLTTTCAPHGFALEAKEGELTDPVVRIERTVAQGRTAAEPQVEYTFELDSDGNWQHRSERTQRTGELDSSDLDQLQQRLSEWLAPYREAQREESDRSAPRLSVTWYEDRREHQVDLPPLTPLARRLDGLVRAVTESRLDWREFDQPLPAVRRVELPELERPAPPDRAPLGEPTVVRDRRQLQRAVVVPQWAAAVEPHVDWPQEKVLVFRWSGSGQDQLFADVEQRDGETHIRFRYEPGFTRDLRPHTYVFVVPRGSTWTIGGTR